MHILLKCCFSKSLNSTGESNVIQNATSLCNRIRTIYMYVNDQTWFFPPINDHFSIEHYPISRSETGHKYE